MGLLVSGATAIPLETELKLLAQIAEADFSAQQSGFSAWVLKVHDALVETNAKYPFIAYGTDWLAFAHFVIAIAFIGPLRDPVKNIWVVEFGMIACVMVVPFALVMGSVRGIPFGWRLIDCSFGVFGIIPLWFCRQQIQQLARLPEPQRRSPSHIGTALAIVASVLLVGCQYDPYAHRFTTVKPKGADVAGSYSLTQQTITRDGLSVLRGQSCQLDLRANGSFALTNYPTWSEAFSATNGQLVGLISTTGRWSCATVGTVSDGRTSKEHWGVVFSESGQKLESLSLTGQAPPYGLIMTHGDPDAGTVMIFKRTK